MSDDLRTDILVAIRTGQADELLEDVAVAVRARRAVLGRELLRVLKPGMRVKTKPPLKQDMVGLSGTVVFVGATLVKLVLDAGQRAGGYKAQQCVDKRSAVGVPATCIDLLDDQTLPSGTTVVNGAVIHEIPLEDESSLARRPSIRRRD